MFDLLALYNNAVCGLPSLGSTFCVPVRRCFRLAGNRVNGTVSMGSFIAAINFFLSVCFTSGLPHECAVSFSLVTAKLLNICLAAVPKC